LNIKINQISNSQLKMITGQRREVAGAGEREEGAGAEGGEQTHYKLSNQLVLSRLWICKSSKAIS
jgi:hypothetical protein